MKKLIYFLTLFFILFLSLLTRVVAKDIKVGIMLGFTGPIESLTPAIADAAELAFKETSASGELLDEARIVPIRGDSTCVNSSVAVNNAKKLIKSFNNI